MDDLVIRGGTVVDGSGGPPRRADVAVSGDRIAAVGGDIGPGAREIDASGRLVTPGWVDIHTHYDGQATWDEHLTPSGWHGVTTVVMGNCGVGFAPVRDGEQDFLIQLMEGVEDIPGTALAEGMTWGWETFAEYLDAVDARPRSVDVGAQVAHGPVRAYVMGQRGADNEEATDRDIAAMAAIVREGLAAGALGFSTSRTWLHRAKSGELVPGTTAGEDELLGIGRALGEAGHGVFQVASDLMPEDPEIAWMQRISRETGRTVTFSLLQNRIEPDQWRRMLAVCERDAAEGGHLRPMVAQRPAGVLLGFEGTVHPFIFSPGYAAVAHLPPDERLERLAEPDVRASILDDPPDLDSFDGLVAAVTKGFSNQFPLGDPPEYEPGPESSIAAIAAREGRSPFEVAYDVLMQGGGRGLIYLPILDYVEGNLDNTRELMLHPRSVFGLSDGGAHCGVICDSSVPTYLLTHWARDRTRGERIPVETVVAAQTRETAELYGLRDRGLLAEGMRADVNVIDFEGLRLHAPRMVYDLPAGGRRLIQEVDGYSYTICAGTVTYEGGRPTGALPGRLVRGPQPAPAD
jgi:N-acyl-D-aspartate/D-glutamate deacylase